MSEMAELSRLADELRLQQVALQKAEADLARAKTRVAYLAEEAIPELMEEIGLEQFTTASGLTISVAEKVFANISSQNEDAAFAWLDTHGHGGMVRREILVSFDREQQEAARRLRDKLRESYPGVSERRKVHPSTLRAWVKRRLENGEEVPPMISVARRPVASVTK